MRSCAVSELKLMETVYAPGTERLVTRTSALLFVSSYKERTVKFTVEARESVSRPLWSFTRPVKNTQIASTSRLPLLQCRSQYALAWTGTGLLGGNGYPDRI